MHRQNISQFVEAADRVSSPLLQAYLGLVALELVLKSLVPLTNHDVGSGLTRFKNIHCVGAKQRCAQTLTGMIARLRNDIQGICVNDRVGTARYSPVDSYPFIRYARLDGDGWPAPFCDVGDLPRLARSVQQVRAFLRKEFGLPL